MDIYRVATPDLDLSVEKGTPAVPGDGLYHVLCRGHVLASVRSEKKALAIYRAKRSELLEAGGTIHQPEKRNSDEMLAQLRAEQLARSMKADWHSTVGRAQQLKGGRGRGRK